MKRKRLLAQLEELAARLEIEIRRENLGKSRGGLCRVEDKLFILVNKGLSDASAIELLSTELSRFDTAQMYLLPEVRESLDKSIRKREMDE